MARSARKSLAGSAAAAAKKMIGGRRGEAPTQAAAVEEPAAKKAPVKKAPAKKAPAKKAPAKKAPAKKAPAGSLAVREDESAWTRAELEEVAGELREQHDRLTALLDDAEKELAGLMRDAGDGAGHDQADMGATSFERDQERTVVINEREMLAQVDHALARIEDGSYGVCESCGEPIGKMRLMAFTRATLCLTCKQREERR